MAEYIPHQLVGDKTAGQLARYAKEAFGRHSVTSYELTGITYDVPSSVEVEALVNVEDDASVIRFRMIRWTHDGNGALPDEADATWQVAVWAPETFFQPAT